MKIKLMESKWEHKVEGKPFYDAIEEGESLDSIAEVSEDILTQCKDFFEDDYIIDSIDDIIDGFKDSESTDEINAMLDELYDFCDDYNVLIVVEELPDDAEIFVDDKEEGEEEKEEETTDIDDIEQIDVVEIDPESDDDMVVIGDEDIEESCKSK